MLTWQVYLVLLQLWRLEFTGELLKECIVVFLLLLRVLKKEFVLGAKEVELLVKIKVDLIFREAIATELQLASGGEFLVF